MQQPIYADDKQDKPDPPIVRRQKIVDYLGKSMLPNLMPGERGLNSWFRGGYGFHELMDAIAQEASFPKRDFKPLPQAALGALGGLKTQEIDIGKYISYAQSEREKIKQQLRSSAKSIAAHEGVSEEDAEWYIEALVEHMLERAEPPQTPKLRPQIGEE
jgi:hypothetical protein